LFLLFAVLCLDILDASRVDDGLDIVVKHKVDDIEIVTTGGLLYAACNAVPTGKLGIQEQKTDSTFVFQKSEDVTSASILRKRFEKDVPKLMRIGRVPEKLIDGIKIKFDIYEGTIILVTADNFFLTTSLKNIFCIDGDIVLMFFY